MTTDTLTIPQAAERLGISPTLAYRMARSGQLPGHFRLGRRHLVAVVSLERFFACQGITNPKEEASS